jgi:regulator of sirC expression with transglutaminase-like and TPR domain
MTETPARRPFNDRAGAIAFLKSLGQSGDGSLPIADAALALASLDRPRVDLERYFRHLDELAAGVKAALAAGADDLEARATALNEAILQRHGYAGDTLTYEDPQNANLMRVIDRRRGLPVALGILYLHAGRAQGWDMAGLAFPGHFLVRCAASGARLILDPFNRGEVQDAGGLRRLLKTVSGGDIELSPAHYADVPDREVLLRLQNNLKLRLLGSQQPEKALAVIENMLLLAPEHAGLLREQGLVNAELGNLGAAIRALEASLARLGDSQLRFATAALVQDLKKRLH